MPKRVGMAQQPGMLYDPARMLDLRGGVNNSMSDEFISHNELSDARNYIPDFNNAGVLIKRTGVSRHLANSQTTAFTSIYEGVITNYFTNSTTIKQFSSNTAITSGLTASTAPDWTSLASMDIYVNGVDAPRKVTAGPTGAALGGSPPTFKYVEAYNNMIVGAGHSTGIIRLSDPGTTETWPADSAYILTNDENDDIVGLKKHRDVLVVFCEKSFHHFRGFAPILDFNLTFSSFEEGCTSHRSIVSCPYGLFWWSKVGVCWSKDGFTIDYPMLRKLSKTLDGLNRGAYGTVHASWHPRFQCIQFFVPNGSSTTMNMRIDYYPGTDAFFLHSGAGVEMGASGTVTVSGVAEIYTGSAGANGYLYKQTGSLDDAAVISAYLETKRDVGELGQLAVKRAVTLTPVVYIPGPATVSYSVILDNDVSQVRTWELPYKDTGNFLLGTSVLGTGILHGGEFIQEPVLGFNKKWSKIKHRISDESTERCGVRGIINRGYAVIV